MATRNQGSRSLGRVGVAILAGFLAASSLLAISVVEKGSGDRTRDRLIRLRIMDMLVLNYGSTNWYGVTSSLAAHPEDPGNAAVMSVFLSIGNVHLNRFEKDGDLAHLDRSLLFFEWVVANRSLWGERQGSVVSYLDISVRRLQKECDVGDDGGRIDALANMAMAITAEEADSVLASKGIESTLPIAGDASQVSLLAAAASFLKDDARAAGWGQQAAQLASDLQTYDCASLENAVDLSLGALSYRLAGEPIPGGFSDVTFYGEFRPSHCSPIVGGYVTSGPVSIVTSGATLDAAVHDAEMVAIYLEEYLWFFPPGFGCGPFDYPDGPPIDRNR